MHEKVLPGSSSDLLAAFEQLSSPLLNGWTLAAGTGLALHLAHRSIEQRSNDSSMEDAVVSLEPEIALEPRRDAAGIPILKLKPQGPRILLSTEQASRMSVLNAVTDRFSGF